MGILSHLYLLLAPKVFFTDNFLAAVTNLHAWFSVEILTYETFLVNAMQTICYSFPLLSLVIPTSIWLQDATYISTVIFHKHI